NFSHVRSGTMTYADLARPLTYHDLHELTDEMVDRMLWIVRDATDADVVFVPIDPNASDTFATEGEENIAWTLGHVIAHAIAAARAKEPPALPPPLAPDLTPEVPRPCEPPGRVATPLPRFPTRLYESRRMRHAFLNAWPDPPHREIVQPSERLGDIDCFIR